MHYVENVRYVGCLSGTAHYLCYVRSVVVNACNVVSKIQKKDRSVFEMEAMLVCLYENVEETLKKNKINLAQNIRMLC